MQSKKLVNCLFFSTAFLLFNLTAVPSPAAENRAVKYTKIATNDDTTFIFAGRCPNGQAYRLVSTDVVIEGKVYASYNYEGPVGKGTVRTRATPKTMAVRICRALAEIVDDPV